jgi:twinkle protein
MAENFSMTKDVMKWLQEVRKLDGDLLSFMGVQARDHKSLGAAVAFPYRRNGKAYAAKFRTIDKQFRSTEGVSRGLYNEDELRTRPSLPIVICEGEIDALSIIQAGWERCVSVPDGWTKDGNKTEALVAAEADLRTSPYVVVAADQDEAGESLPRAVANILAGHDVRYATWPDGCKDANDVLVKLGEGALASCLNAAKRIDPPGGVISGFSDLPPMSVQRVLRVGQDPFDKVIALELGEMSVWTGLPGHGKSTLVTWVADEVSQNEGIRIGNIGFETHPFRIRDQLSRSHYRKPFKDLDAGQRVAFLADLDARWRLVHLSDEGGFENNLAWLESMVKALVIRDGCKLVIIDPWNELEHMLQPGENMTSYVNFALKFIRRLAAKLEAHIMVVAHPKKMMTDGKPRPPTGYDIADSAAFFNKPGLGITVHPGEAEFAVQIINWKTRDTMLYRTQRGRIEVEFAPVWGVYRPFGVEGPQQADFGGF